MRLRRLLFGGLATALLWQTLLICILPMLIVAIAALYGSAAIVRRQFAGEAQYMADQVASSLNDTAATTSEMADVLAASPTIGRLTAAGDGQGLQAALLPLRDRLGVDVLRVTDASGDVLAAVPDSPPGGQPLAAAPERANGDPPGGWALFDEPNGLILHAAAPIMESPSMENPSEESSSAEGRGAAGTTIGAVDVGVLVGPSFLGSKQQTSQAELAFRWNDRVIASTMDIGAVRLPSSAEVASQPSHRVTHVVTVRGKRYEATLTPIESHSDDRLTLAVLMPLTPIESLTHSLWLVLSAVSVALSIAVMVVAWRMGRNILAPFRQLVSAALRIQGGDLATRVQPTAQHEIGVLEVTFNTMIDSLAERERERASHEATLLHMASHDPLTGLPNRSLLERRLHEAIAEAARGRPSTLLYIDLDQFKIVNDTLGHGSGDRLLVTLADLVASVLRSEDVLARLGGDEFGALLPGLDVEDALQVAERVRRAVGGYRFLEGGQGFALGASVGVAAISASSSVDNVLGQADIACYTAKSEGRNRVAAYEPEAATLALLSGDGRWAVELKDALHDNRLHLVFQPVTRLSGRSIDHYESLVRLVGRDGDLIGPTAFIPAAERSGLIRDVDHWVLNAALRRMRQEAARGNRIRLAINLSGITLGSSESAEFIRRAIEANGVDPAALIFEITETALMTNLSKGQTTIEGLRALGCHVALDDFGSGSSSFSYLARLPVDSVKIDGSFVRDMATNSVNQAIVRAIATVTHSMGKQSVAEWVEDADTLAILRRLHVDLAQGFFIGYPSSQLSGSHGVEEPQPGPERRSGKSA